MERCRWERIEVKGVEDEEYRAQRHKARTIFLIRSGFYYSAVIIQCQFKTFNNLQYGVKAVACLLHSTL